MVWILCGQPESRGEAEGVAARGMHQKQFEMEWLSWLLLLLHSLLKSSCLFKMMMLLFHHIYSDAKQ